jgi:hypothetical protein
MSAPTSQSQSQFQGKTLSRISRTVQRIPHGLRDKLRAPPLTFGLFTMNKCFMRNVFSVGIAMLLAVSISGCVSSPSPPQSKTDWYVGTFEGGTSGKNAKRLYVSCPTQTQCRLSMSSVSLAQVVPVAVNSAIPQKALAQTRRVYETNPGFFDERFKEDLALVRPLLAVSTRFESCVDVGGSIQNMFFLCSTSADPSAKKGAVVLGATLEPYSESACRTKLYCEYYLVPVSRK